MDTGLKDIVNRPLVNTAQTAERALAEAGLQLQAVFKLADLDESQLPGITRHQAEYPQNQCLLFAHGGQILWQQLHNQWPDYASHPDAVDCYSRDRVREYLKSRGIDDQALFVYPFNETEHCDEPHLQALGERAGWHHDSPLMIGMHGKYGSWFAYRALVLTTSALPETCPASDPAPCDSCATKPCIQACPASAVQQDGLDMQACAEHRLQASSECAETCHARLACPFGREYQYRPEQMAWHYRRSLQSLKRWRSSEQIGINRAR